MAERNRHVAKKLIKLNEAEVDQLIRRLNNFVSRTRWEQCPFKRIVFRHDGGRFSINRHCLGFCAVLIPECVDSRRDIYGGSGQVDWSYDVVSCPRLCGIPSVSSLTITRRVLKALREQDWIE